MPIIILGAVGFFLSRILTAYQLGHIDGVWEPFFASPSALNGTEYIITSDVSKAWPVADGGIGAMSYMFEILMGVMGGRARWRTMPWMVTLFGIVVVPLGVISIYFIIIQPIMIGTYCTICLMAAAAMLIMIPYSLDELVAMGQFLVLNTRRGRPFWRSFFRGDALPGGSKDSHPGFDAALAGLQHQPANAFSSNAAPPGLAPGVPLGGVSPPLGAVETVLVPAGHTGGALETVAQGIRILARRI